MRPGEQSLTKPSTYAFVYLGRQSILAEPSAQFSGARSLLLSCQELTAKRRTADIEEQAHLSSLRALIGLSV